MTDLAEDLRETLDELHDQLAASGDLDEESRVLLTDTMAEIRSKLFEQDGRPSSVPTNWAERLRDSIERFEDSHAHLVRAVDKVARALANIGF